MKAPMKVRRLAGQLPGAIALVVALAGGASAATLARNSVVSSSIRDGAIRSGDLRSGAVGSAAVADGTLTGADVASGRLGSADLAAGSLDGRVVRDGSLTGAQLDPSSVPTLPAAEVAGSARGLGYACSPTSSTYVGCGSVQVSLPTSGRLYLVGAVAAHSGIEDYATGYCRIVVDGSVVPGSTVYARELRDEVLSMHAVSGDIAPGSHTAGLQCNSTAGGLTWPQTSLAVMTIGS